LNSGRRVAVLVTNECPGAFEAVRPALPEFATEKQSDFAIKDNSIRATSLNERTKPDVCFGSGIGLRHQVAARGAQKRGLYLNGKGNRFSQFDGCWIGPLKRENSTVNIGHGGCRIL
jgi:hypothetical protein